jgi:hypothetical protein
MSVGMTKDLEKVRVSSPEATWRHLNVCATAVNIALGGRPGKKGVIVVAAPQSTSKDGLRGTQQV